MIAEAISMARSKLHKDGNPNDRQIVKASGVKGQTQNHDPTLVSLFAQSVGIILDYRRSPLVPKY